MSEISYNSATKNSFPGELSPVYLIQGDDAALKREAVGKILDQALDPSFADFDRETIDFGAGGDGAEEDDPAGRILAAAASAPFMSSRRTVVATSVQKLSKESQDNIALGVKSLGALSCLVLCVDAPVYEAGKPKGKQIENSLKKAVAAAGCIVSCQAPDAKDLRTRAAELLKERGKTAEKSVIDLLAAKSVSASSSSGGDLNTLKSEVEKLVAYAGDQEKITLRDAEELIAAAPEENIFKLLDAVTASDVKSAVRQTEILLGSGEKPDAVAARTLVMLQRQFRILSLAKALGERKGGIKAAMSEDFKILLSGELIGLMSSQGYRLNGYAQTASRFSWERLSESMKDILLCDMALKGIESGRSQKSARLFASGQPADNLRLLVFQLCKSR